MTDTSALPQTVDEALAAEAEIAARAEIVRDDYFAEAGKFNRRLEPELFRLLYPLLCEPIQRAFIQHEPPVKGKPYASTGIRSVQVQIDRMNAVLTPLWWWYEDEYALDGKLCTVTVYVGDRDLEVGQAERAGEGMAVALGSGQRRKGVLVARSSKGGVGQGSSIGNVYKGSFTNAAKLAFARLGPGHEVYVGAFDQDPDVNREVADRQPAPEDPSDADGTISEEIAKQLVKRAWQVGEKDRLQLAASRLAKRDVGDCSSQAKATQALRALTYEQAEQLGNWLSAQADKAAAGGE